MKSIYVEDNWLELQQAKENGLGIKYQYQCSGGRIEYHFIKRTAGTVNGVTYFDTTTPRGQSGPHITTSVEGAEKDIVKGFAQDFAVFCKRENIIAEYVKFDPWRDQSEYFGGVYLLRPYGHLYCNNLTTDFFMGEYKKSCRHGIRKAYRNGLTAQFDFTGATLDTFLRMYKFTESKYQVSEYYKFDQKFIEEYYRLLPGRVVIANVIIENKIIASSLVLFGDDIAHDHLGGSDPEYNHFQPNSLVLYETSLLAAQYGKKLMDLGGAVPGSGVESFKLNFVRRAQPYIYKVGTKIHNQKVYDALVKMAGGPRTGFFPEYRR